jgi:hypothetical protein
LANWSCFMYAVELSLRLSPLPVSVQRRERADAEALYQHVREAMEHGEPRLIDLTCEKAEEKRVCLLSCEVLAVQMYEKSALGTGSKRPGFSIDG